MSGVIYHRPSDVIRQLLIDLGLGIYPDDSVTDWQIFTSKEPAQPDQVITVYDTDPRLGGREHVTGEKLEQYGFQVRVRGNDDTLTHLKCRNIANKFDTDVFLKDVDVESTHRYAVHSIARTSGVIPLGTEGTTRRKLFTLNATVSMRFASLLGT